MRDLLSISAPSFLFLNPHFPMSVISDTILSILCYILVFSIPWGPSMAMTTCSRHSLLRLCAIHLDFPLIITTNVVLFSLTLHSISSYVTLYIHLIFSILLQRHIFKFSRWFFSALPNIHISSDTPYVTSQKFLSQLQVQYARQ